MNLYIDIGSTNIKYRINERDLTVKSLSFPKPIFSNLKDSYIVDSGEIFKIIQNIIYEYKCAIENIFFSVQMHGYVLKYRDGSFSPYISWQDRRGGEVLKEFSEIYGEQFNSHCGTSIKENLPAVSMFYNVKFNIEKTEQIEQFFTLGSYLVYMLTGENCTHITDATCSGFYDVKGRLNNVLVCDIFGQSVKMPTVCMTVKAVGNCGKLSIFSPIGDQQCSIHAITQLDSQTAILNLGTAGQLCYVSTIFTQGNFESRPYFDGKTLATISGLKGGKYIYNRTRLENTQPHIVEKELIENYQYALSQFGDINTIIAIGGTIKHNYALICNVLKAVCEQFKIYKDVTALDGLERISAEVAQ